MSRAERGKNGTRGGRCGALRTPGTGAAAWPRLRGSDLKGMGAPLPGRRTGDAGLTLDDDAAILDAEFDADTDGAGALAMANDLLTNAQKHLLEPITNAFNTNDVLRFERGRWVFISSSRK